MLIKILSWNVWNENPNSPRKILKFIKSHGADIMCLQEVTEDVLEEIEKSGDYHHVTALGMESQTFGACFLVILSKFPIQNYAAIPVKPQNKRWSIFKWWTKLEEHIESQFVIIEVDGGIMLQVFNVHLPVGAGPVMRMRQFKNIVKQKRKGLIHIFAGDFNIYADKWHHRFAGWLFLGHSGRDLWMNERRLFERMFKKHKWTNIFKKKTTYSLFPGFSFQFDHIIIPDAVRVVGMHVHNDSGGSDHKLIIADIEI